jgi:hypothetical protein
MNAAALTESMMIYLVQRSSVWYCIILPGSIQDNLFIITACMASTVTRVLWYRMSVLYDDVCFLSRGI